MYGIHNYRNYFQEAIENLHFHEEYLLYMIRFVAIRNNKIPPMKILNEKYEKIAGLKKKKKKRTEFRLIFKLTKIS